MDHETTTQVATVAIWVAWMTGASLTLAVLGAACEAMWPGSLAWTWVGFFSGLSVALRLFMLVTLLGLAWRILVTYLHPYRGHPVTRHGRLPESTRRRVAGTGRLMQGAGRHRAA